MNKITLEKLCEIVKVISVNNLSKDTELDYFNIVMKYGGKTNLKKFILEFREKNQFIVRSVIKQKIQV